MFPHVELNRSWLSICFNRARMNASVTVIDCCNTSSSLGLRLSDACYCSVVVLFLLSLLLLLGDSAVLLERSLDRCLPPYIDISDSVCLWIGYAVFGSVFVCVLVCLSVPQLPLMMVVLVAVPAVSMPAYVFIWATSLVCACLYRSNFKLERR